MPEVGSLLHSEMILPEFVDLGRIPLQEYFFAEADILNANCENVQKWAEYIVPIRSFGLIYYDVCYLSYPLRFK